jgi:rhodanese-related sulfurtransferase
MNSAYFIAIAFLLFVSCGPKGEPTAQQLDMAAFETRLENTPERILLDVRTPEEYQGGHFPNATLINIKDADFIELVSALDRSKPVFVYCASGIRSEKAVIVLNDLGFDEVYELQGGFNEWARAGKPFVKD